MDTTTLKAKVTKIVKGSQLAAIIILIALSYSNTDHKYIAENPHGFITNCVVYAIIGSLATALICWNRNSKIFKHVFLAFLLFFMYQVIREFSGWYKYENTTTTTPVSSNSSQQNKSFSLILLGLSLLGLLLAYYAFQIREEIPFMKIGGNYSFLIESVIFAIILSIGDRIIADNHNIPLNSMKTLKSFFIYIVLQYILQYSGYLKHLFKNKK
jgi:hypothetical protein